MPFYRFGKQRKNCWKGKELFKMHLKVTNRKQEKDKPQSTPDCTTEIIGHKCSQDSKYHCKSRFNLQ